MLRISPILNNSNIVSVKFYHKFGYSYTDTFVNFHNDDKYLELSNIEVKEGFGISKIVGSEMLNSIFVDEWRDYLLIGSQNNDPVA